MKNRMNTIENVKKEDELIRIKREEAFIISTSRVSSQFEHVEIKTAIRKNTSVVSNIERAMHRADLISGRERDRDRKRDRKRSSDRERRDREREQTAMSERT
jgi:hypothetical protein